MIPEDSRKRVLFLLLAQIVPGHFLGLRDTQHAQHGWRNVTQRAIWLQRKLLAICGDDNEGHRIGGVRGVRAAGFRIDHHFGVSVIGGD